MGKQNRQRRAAKARKRAKRRGQSSPHRSLRPGASHERHRKHAWDGADADSSVERHRFVEHRLAEYEAELETLVAILWRHGWQPVELVRHVRRNTSGSAPIELLRHAIAADHARRAPSTLHERWRAQVVELDLPHLILGRPWLPRLVGRLDEPLAAVTALLVCLGNLGPLLRLIPPPGARPDEIDVALGTPGGDVNDPVLARVRALLAKAEATPYPAEAEAFTAKAHELMTRHALDAALVTGSTARAAWTAIRLPVDEPYLDEKALLLHQVAEHTRCRAIHHVRYALCTVVGAGDDVAAVELLFTSLLLQAHQAMVAEGADAHTGARQRSRGFRASFLRAYAIRIGERLAQVGATVAADVERTTGTNVLPVLANRRCELDDIVEKLFGELRKVRHRRSWDAAGWERGRAAADNARLREPDLEAGPPSRRGPGPDALDPAS